MKRILTLLVLALFFSGLADLQSQTVKLGRSADYVVVSGAGLSVRDVAGKALLPASEVGHAQIAGLYYPAQEAEDGIFVLAWQHDASLLSQAFADMNSAYAEIWKTPADEMHSTGASIGGKVFSPGIYEWNGDVHITGHIAFEGEAGDTWIFRINGNLQQDDETYVLPGCGTEDNVFWIVSGSATIGSDAKIGGTILSMDNIVLQEGAKIDGRLLAKNDISAEIQAFEAEEEGILTITKEADQQTYYYVGQEITYTIVVYNAGTLPIFDVTVTDPLTGLDVHIYVLNPCNPYTYYVRYQVTQEDIDRGYVTNTVCGESMNLEHHECTSETVYAIQNPLLSLTKVAGKQSVDAAGETIDYLISVANEGNVTIFNSIITDDLTGESWTIDVLSPGESQSFETSYLTLLSDINNGEIINQAKAVGYTLLDEEITASDNARVDVVQKGEIQITKTAEQDSFSVVGEVIGFVITIENVGNVTLSNVVITDDLTDDTWELESLEPGERHIYNTSYIITQQDIDRGSITNLAVVSSTDPAGEPVEDSDEIILPAIQHAAISIEKTARPLLYQAVGDIISYEIVAVNTGNVSLTDIMILDDLTAETWYADLFMPGGVITHTASYEITQYDLEMGAVTNTVIITALDPTGEKIEADDEAIVTAVQMPAMIITKTASVETYSSHAEEIAYVITLTNTGNVSIVDISVVDDLTGDTWFVETLLPGEQVQFNSLYEVTQDDIDFGHVNNQVVAKGFGPMQQAVEANDEAMVTAVQMPAITITKTPSVDTYSRPGEEIDYEITLINTGNVRIFNITISDDLTDDSWFVEMLLPGDQVQFEAVYSITQGDIDFGSVDNQVVAGGFDPMQQPVDAIDSAVVSAVWEPGIQITKTALTGSYQKPGDQIDYEITVTNTGNVSLFDLVVTDDLTGETWTAPLLSPDEALVFNTVYAVTQHDIDFGQVANTASVEAVNPGEQAVNDQDVAIVSALRNPAISIQKSAQQEAFSNAGEIISYLIVIENTGNLTLFDGLVSDDLTGETWRFDQLLPEEIFTVTANYEITQADIDNGGVINLATVTASDFHGTEIEADDTAEIQGIRSPGITISKTAAVTTYSSAGEIITYEIVVTNTGNVSLFEAVITDDLTEESWTIDVLLPGQQRVFATTYQISQADIDAGMVENIAKVLALDPAGNEMEAADTALISAIWSASVSITKTAGQMTFAGVGDRLTYSIVLTNTGNVSLFDVQVEDDLTGDTWDVALLLPGEIRTFETTYTVVQDDVDAGLVHNLVVASGTDPQNNVIDAQDEAIVTVVQEGALTITKTANPQTYNAAGDQITYEILVANSGNVSLRDIQISDDKTGDSWTITSLLPGAQEVFVTTYVVTQEDVNSGSVLNTVTAIGFDADNHQYEVTDDEVVTAIKDPSLTLVKTAQPGVFSSVGNVINYTITITNNGNVSLLNIQVVDPATTGSWFVDRLEPGEIRTFQTSHTITQQDMDLGAFVNTALAAGKDPDGNDVSAEGSQQVNAVQQNPSILVTKVADPPVFISDGELITYTVVVQNTGNVTLFDIEVYDNLTGDVWTVLSLPPGESRQFSATYRITAADLSRGDVVNEVTASGYDLKRNLVTSTAQERIITIRVPGGLTPDIEYDNILVIIGIDYFPQNVFKIFNRYGTLIYEASPYVNDWDGKPNRGSVITDGDGRVPAGTYYYVLELKPGHKLLSGYIYLIKN